MPGIVPTKVTPELVTNPDKARPRGSSVALSDDDVAWALERLACGDSMKNVMATLGVTRNALLKRAKVDDTFGRELWVAMEIGTFAMLENAVDELRDPTTDFNRARELLRHAQWFASRIGRRHFSESVEVSHKTVIQYTIKDEDRDW